MAPSERPSSTPSATATVRSEAGATSTPAGIDHGRFLPGAMVAGRFRMVGRLGRGGMGEVYRADDLRLGHAVALKFLPEKLARDPDRLARLRDEVRVARQIAHPNLCRVYDLHDTEAGEPFLVMEYVAGEDLATLLQRIGRLPVDKGLQISRQLCAGLAAAHERGVLHRDLKPANVMLDERGMVRITDFGLAATLLEAAQASAREGTPMYMAPEQLDGRPASVRSDVYALGLVLHELFTGQRPHRADSLADLLKVRQAGTPIEPSRLVEGLDPGLERVIRRCLEPSPRDRPASAIAVAAALPGGDPLAAALAAGDAVARAGGGRRRTPAASRREPPWPAWARPRAPSSPWVCSSRAWRRSLSPPIIRPRCWPRPPATSLRASRAGRGCPSRPTASPTTTTTRGTWVPRPSPSRTAAAAWRLAPSCASGIARARSRSPPPGT